MDLKYTQILDLQRSIIQYCGLNGKFLPYAHIFEHLYEHIDALLKVCHWGKLWEFLSLPHFQFAVFTFSIQLGC